MEIGIFVLLAACVLLLVFWLGERFDCNCAKRLNDTWRKWHDAQMSRADMLQRELDAAKIESKNKLFNLTLDNENLKRQCETWKSGHLESESKLDAIMSILDPDFGDES